MLAQSWLYGQRKPTKYDAYIERHLKLPDKFDKHADIAMLNLLAERIVFTNDIPSMLYQMHADKQLTFSGILQSVKLPYDCFWIEYGSTLGIGADTTIPDETLQRVYYGALVQRRSDTCVRFYVIIGMRFRTGEILSTVTQVLECDPWPPIVKVVDTDGKEKQSISLHVIHVFNPDGFKERRDTAVKDIVATVVELIFGIFLVTQPKVYTEERVKWSPRLAAIRAERKKPPLLEYRKIHVHVCKPHKRYSSGKHSGQSTASARAKLDFNDAHVDTESDASIQHRRYHKVMGHFRHYINRTPPHTVWIEPHYRGDPALGVTFTERDVMK